jgi:hypothetical protein
MAMSMYGLFGYAAASRQAAEAASNAARMGTKADQATAAVNEVAERLDKLSLVCLSMWSLLLEHTELTEEDLMERVREIDAQDGVADGKITRKVQKCAKCGRTMSPRHNKCLYCGAEELKLSAFDEIT